MARDDWYRNTDWNPAVEADFRTRLARAYRRTRPQYLRAQAHHLTDSNPRVALALLDEFFALNGEDVFAAQAHVERARAFLALGDLQAALSAYQDALAAERVFPQVITTAYTDFACLVVERRVASLYRRALQVLDQRADDTDELVFPIERYRKHGARALLLLELGRPDEAVIAAAVAMEAAGQVHSGFHHHPDLGLVKDTSDELGMRVAALARQLAPSDRGSRTH